jgi:SAM-dependent methyltransferase
MTTIFGAAYAPAYDTIYESKDYEGEVRLLRRIFLKHATGPVGRILDLGCGSGAHAVRLATDGFRVVGVDRSPEMLTVARATAERKGLTVEFVEQDLRHVDLNQSFDAVIMMFAVLSYQTGDDDVQAALRSARRHLRPGGLLVFDVWFGPAVLAQRPEARVREIARSDEVWIRHTTGNLEIDRNLCHVNIRLVHQAVGGISSESRERHTLRYFFLRELEDFLLSAGFRLMHFGAFPDFDQAPSEHTWNVMAVAVAVDT